VDNGHHQSPHTARSRSVHGSTVSLSPDSGSRPGPARLRGQTLTQGQANGFPEYRLGSGRVTGPHRRFSECFRSFRAEPFELGSPEYIDLEVFVTARGNGLPIETPAVRY
jgi:hypothetical protein